MVDYMDKYKRGLKAMNRTAKCRPKPGEIWWVSDLDGIKDRPILVLSCNGDVVTYRKCTSQASVIRQRDLIEDCLEAGLDKPTYVDPERFTIPRSRLDRRMGKLSEEDRSKFGLRSQVRFLSDGLTAGALDRASAADVSCRRILRLLQRLSLLDASLIFSVSILLGSLSFFERMSYESVMAGRFLDVESLGQHIPASPSLSTSPIRQDLRQTALRPGFSPGSMDGAELHQLFSDSFAVDSWVMSFASSPMRPGPRHSSLDILEPEHGGVTITG